MLILLRAVILRIYTKRLRKWSLLYFCTVINAVYMHIYFLWNDKWDPCMWLCARPKCELKLYLNRKVKLVQTIQNTNCSSKDHQQVYTTPKTKVHIQVINHICLPLLIQYKTEKLLRIVVIPCDGIIPTCNSALHMQKKMFKHNTSP